MMVQANNAVSCHKKKDAATLKKRPHITLNY